MTHSGGKPHTNVGDRGQRYEVLANGYPKNQTDNIIGWSDTIEGATQMMEAIILAPSCTSARIFDRVDQIGVDKRYARTLDE